MYPASQTFLAALRGPHAAVVAVDAYRDGAQLNSSPLPVFAGQVAVDSASRVRRKLDLTLAPRMVSGGYGSAELWDMLTPEGTELRAYRGVRFPDGSAEMIPLGVFGIDEQGLGLGADGDLRISGADRYAAVQRARFLRPATSMRGALVKDEIARLMQGARADLPTPIVTATSTAVIRPTVWERDRDKAIEDLSTAIGAEAFFDADGVPVVRDTPTLSQVPVWWIDAGENGVLLPGGTRTRSRTGTYNTVVVTAAQINGGPPPFAPVVVSDDPANAIPFFHSDPQITTVTQAQRAGRALLEKVRGLAAQLRLAASPNPALDAGDVIDAVLPFDPMLGSQVIERHIVDSLTVPLAVTEAQDISTRSTKPDLEENG